jgi:hypothetical protein
MEVRVMKRREFLLFATGTAALAVPALSQVPMAATLPPAAAPAAHAPRTSVPAERKFQAELPPWPGPPTWHDRYLW